MQRYENAKLYRLVNTVDAKQYYGSTCTTLPKRLYFHKSRAKANCSPMYRHFNAIGWNNVSIILVRNVECKSKAELLSEERKETEAAKARGEDVLNKNRAI